VGNPPFFVVNSNHEQFRSIFKSGEFEEIITENVNIASLFLYRYAQKLKQDGQLAFIFPRSLLHVQSFSQLRKFLLKTRIQYIFDLGKAFSKVGLTQIILIIQNSTPIQNKIQYSLLDYNKSTQNITECISYQIPQDYFQFTPNFVFEIFSGTKINQLCSGDQIKTHIFAISKKTKFLDYCNVDPLLGLPGISRGLGYQQHTIKNKKNLNDLTIIGGRAIFNFGRKGRETEGYLNYTAIINANMTNKERFQAYYPKIMIQNLASSKIRIVGCYDETIVSHDASNRPIYAITNDTITNIFPKEKKYAKFLLALLLSDLFTYYLRDFIFIRQNLTIHLDKPYLEHLPIVHPSAVQLIYITNMVEQLEHFVQERQIEKAVLSRQKPYWENPSNLHYTTFTAMIIQLNKAIYDLYQIPPPMIEYINGQLKEFEYYF
jgi:hypothetical protein